MSSVAPTVVLVRPREEGNVGAAARAMANMGLSELVLVEPAVDIGRVARAFAVGAGEILEHARRVPDLATALAPIRRVVGTTSGRGREIGAPVITARELPDLLAADPPDAAAALVFGPEVSGLNRDELALCGVLVRVPCAPRQPTLNLGQAVLLVAYELHCQRPVGAPRAGAGEPPAPVSEVDGLFEHLRDLLTASGFARDDTFRGVFRDLRALASRAAPSSREVRILRGICRRLERRLEHRQRGLAARRR